MVARKGADDLRKSVGFTTTGRSSAPRPHCKVFVDGKEVGEVTSGAFSPTLQRNIGIALIDRDYAGVGKPLHIEIRGKLIEAEQVKTPFYKRA